jgi:AcrR family transcriptional regulator
LEGIAYRGAVSSRPAQRGPYAKGVARRQEVLDVALDVLAANGLRHSTLQEIAERVGLTRPGLLHYFGTREDLLVAVLQARHERDSEQGSRLGGSLADHVVHGVLAQHETPGLVRLDAAMAAEATDPTHPAHLYFRGRSRALEGLYVTAIEREIEAGLVDPDVDAALAAQQVNSLVDGLHVQWLIDPSVDVGAVLRDALARLLPAPR